MKMSLRYFHCALFTVVIAVSCILLLITAFVRKKLHSFFEKIMNLGLETRIPIMIS